MRLVADRASGVLFVCEVMMRAQLALLADAANQSADGKLNVLGEFDTIYAPHVPAAWPSMCYVAKIKTTLEDGGRHEFLLKVVDEDGNLVMPPVPFSAAAGIAVAPGEENAGVAIFNLINAQFTDYGVYKFELYADGTRIGETPLYVRPVPVQGPNK